MNHYNKTISVLKGEIGEFINKKNEIQATLTLLAKEYNNYDRKIETNLDLIANLENKLFKTNRQHNSLSSDVIDFTSYMQKRDGN